KVTFPKCTPPGRDREKFPNHTSNPAVVRSVGNDRFYRDTAGAGDDIQRTAQRQYSLAHTDQAEAGLVIRRQTAAVVADAHQGATAISMHSCRLFDRDADGGRVGVA